MRQILAEKGCDSDDTLVLEMIKEAEDLKRNLEKKNKLLRREMEMQRNQQATEDEFRMQQKAMLLRGKAEMQKLKERLQRDNQPVIPEEEVDDIQELHRRVIEEKIDILTKPKKANDMQLFYNLKQKLESPTLSSKFLIDPRYSGLSSAELKLSCECGLSRVLKERNDAKSRIRLDIQESLQKAALKKAGFLRGTSGEEPPSRRCPPSSAHPRTLHSFFQAPYRSLPLLSGRGRQFSRGGARSPPESSASVAQQRARCPRSAPCTLPGCSGLRLRYPDLLWQKVQEED
ncbi:coiled-coil domain-containing protein 196 isoform X2 [Macrotis lagotis]